MTKVILSGANGKMGQVITRLAAEDDKISIIAGKDIKKKKKNDYPVYDDWNQITEKADVIIDFSHPSGLDSLLEYSQKTHTPVVMATTGLSEEQIGKLREHSKETAVFFSANMCLGINLLIDLVVRAEKILGRKASLFRLPDREGQPDLKGQRRWGAFPNGGKAYDGCAGRTGPSQCLRGGDPIFRRNSSRNRGAGACLFPGGEGRLKKLCAG